MIEDVLKDNELVLDINAKHITINTNLISVSRIESNFNKSSICVTLMLEEDSNAGLTALINAYNRLTHIYKTKNPTSVNAKLGISETIRDSIEDELIPVGDFNILGVELNYFKSNIVHIKDSGTRVPVKTYVRHDGKQYLRKLDVYKSLPYVYADIVYQKSVENT